MITTQINSGYQPQATPPPPAHPSQAAPTTLAQLQALLSVQGAGSVIDLQGRSLAGPLTPPGLEVKHPGVTLRNGELQLPERACVTVTAQDVTLADVKLSGTDPGSEQQHGGLVTVEGACASLAMQRCTIQLRNFTPFGTYTCGVLSVEEAQVELVDTQVHGDSSHGYTHTMREWNGVVALGMGSCVRARSCTVTSCVNGFKADDGGVLEVQEGCVATRNKLYGFFASGCRSRLIAADKCLAAENGGSGFTATMGGVLVAGNGCEAIRNRGCGFISTYPDSKLSVGQQCKAERNTGHGFHANKQGSLVAGVRCTAAGNGGSGFEAHDR